MNKKPFIFILSLALSILVTSASLAPAAVSAATKRKATTSIRRTYPKSKKRTVAPKFVDLNPPLITLATAPHSPKPAPKYRTSKKKITRHVIKKKIISTVIKNKITGRVVKRKVA